MSHCPKCNSSMRSLIAPVGDFSPKPCDNPWHTERGTKAATPSTELLHNGIESHRDDPNYEQRNDDRYGDYSAPLRDDGRRW